MAKGRRRGRKGSGGMGGIAVLGVVGAMVLYDYSAALFWLLLAAGVGALGCVLYRLARRRLDPTELERLFADVHLMNGSEFERFTARLFGALGYRATVLGGSGDQGVDVILTDDSHEKIAVQCKNHRKPVGNKPVQEVYAGARHHGCSEGWVVAPAGFTHGARELARSTDVRLLDTPAITRLLNQARRLHEPRDRRTAAGEGAQEPGPVARGWDTRTRKPL